jgi:hypothetical protein
LKKRTSINSISIFHKEKEMADFRKWLLAFAVVALLLGMGTSASAQVNNAAFACTANAGVPPIVRAEGLAELVGDLILNCTGGTFTPAGLPIPQSNVTIFLNTAITSRLYAGNLSEAVLTIDEPFPSNAEVPTPASAAPSTGAALNQLGCQATNSANCQIISSGAGVGATGSYNGTAGHFNVFQGLQNTGGGATNSLVWLGVPIDAPATAGTRVIRITNVRANACALGTSSTLIPTQIVMFIAVNGSQQVTINQPQQVVAFIQHGFTATNGSKNYIQCLNINGNLLSSTVIGQSGSITVSATEGFASSFKVRNYAQLFTAGASNAPNGLPPSVVGFQNVLGFPYNTESGFVSSTPGIAPNGSGTGAIGLADQGTQVAFTITSIPTGVSIFAPAWVFLFPQGQTTGGVPCTVPGGSCTQTGLAVLTGATFTAGATPTPTAVTVTAGTAAVTYEVWYSNPNVVESMNLAISVAAINSSATSPGTGQAQVAISLAPVSSVQTASATAPVPRFCAAPSPVNFFAINACTCDLLFPFVTNQAGFDTGVALANTSTDPFGTTPQQGPVTLWYYGSTTGGGAAPPKATSQTVPSGQELVFTLSNGGNFGIPATPGFQGYIIAVAQFQFCHAFAYISDVGSQRVAEGYIAIQLDLPTLNRTGQQGENEGH